MPTPSDKKLFILYVLDILKEFSDETHLLTQEDISKRVESVSGISSNRKTVAANIAALKEYFTSKHVDMTIKTVERKGCYLSSRTFEDSELRYLVDWIYSSKAIPSKYAKDLANKLLEGESKGTKNKFRYIHNTGNIARVENCDVFYNIEVINDAIENDKKIEFFYLEYNTDKVLVPKHNGKKYVVSPYFMLNNLGRYFLVCKFDGYDDITNYKIDRMKDIKVIGEKRYPANNVKGYESGIIREEYANENPLMCGGKRIKTTLLLHKPFIVNELVETFGKNVTFYKKDEKQYAYVKSSAEAIVSWVFQYGECMEIVAPESQRNKIKALLRAVNDFYKD